jgi:hypothetical protein
MAFHQAKRSDLWRAASSQHGLGAYYMSCSVLSGLNLGLLGDEDAIEEFTLVLAADLADLLDLRAGQGEESVVNAIEDDLALDVSRLSADSATSHLNDLVLLSTKEVLDSDLGAVLGDSNVDGEMSVHKSHLVAEALRKRNIKLKSQLDYTQSVYN